MPDGFVPNPDGSATLTLGGNVYELRAPLLFEYSHLIDSTDDQRWKSVDLLRQANEDRKLIEKEGEAAFRRAREKERAADAIRVTFVIETIKTLGYPAGEAPAEVDTSQWPRWAWSATLMNSLVTHWDTVPFPGSAQPM